MILKSPFYHTFLNIMNATRDSHIKYQLLDSVHNLNEVS